jgi:hypothetical protein
MSNGQQNEDSKLLKRFFTDQDQVVKRNGFFVEMGGLNGITFSNSLIYEYCLGWTGILIEANPVNYRAMIDQRPCATSIWGACCAGGSGGGHITMSGGLGTSHMSTLPHISGLKGKPVKGGSKRTRGKGGKGGIRNRLNNNYNQQRRLLAGDSMAPCRSMASIFHEYNVQWIDLWSLDVEGAELQTLQTVDWTVVQVGVLLIEVGTKDAEIHTLLTETAGMIKVPGNPANYPSCQWERKKAAMRIKGVISMHNSNIYVHKSLRDDTCV